MMTEQPIPISLLQAFQQLAPLSDLLWYTDQQGTPCCLIKIPRDVRFSDLSVIFDTPRETYRPFKVHSVEEWLRLVLPFRTQSAPGQQYSSQSHVFLPSSDDEWHLLVQLTQASSVQLIGYSADLVPRYLGNKQLIWQGSNRRAIQQWLTPRQWLAPRKSETLRPVPVATRSEVRTQQAKPDRWKLPKGVRRSLAAFHVRALITTAEGEGKSLPRIYIKVPEDTRFEEVAVAFGPLNLARYPVGWVLSLSLHLQDAAGRVLLADGLCDPSSVRSLLRKLASTPAVEMFALADTSAFQVLGAKRLTWTEQKQERAQALLEYCRTAKLRGSWEEACAAYLNEHPQGYVFEKPSPHPVGQQKAADGQATLTDQKHKPDEEEITLADASQLEESKISDKAVAGAASVDHTPRVPSLVEQFILLHRSGVYEEYSHLHTLSRHIFWRMLLALAIEKTQRKFVWTPEAAGVIEEHRQQLTPSTMTPWLSSREHLWITFVEPIQTPVCNEAAALFVFSAADPELFRDFARQVRMSSHALKALERTLYLPEKQRVSLGVVNHTGVITWAISLKTDTHGQLHDTEEAWAIPAWYTCSSQQCHLHTEEVATLCEICASTRAFIWTWLVAAWQSLIGRYRIKPAKDFTLESIGEEHIEWLTRPMPQPDGSGIVRHVDLEHHYRVVRAIDIADAPAPSETETVGQRGSWVETLSSIDPALVFYDEREIPLHTRTLRHPRYSRYIQEHGTNQLEVQPHTRHVPMRADPKAMTRVTANRYQKNISRD